MDRRYVSDSQQRSGVIALLGETVFTAGPDSNSRDTFEMDIEDDKSHADDLVSEPWGESSRGIHGDQRYDKQWETSVRRQYNIWERLRRLADRRKLYAFAKQWKWIIVVAGVYFVILAIMVHYRRQVLEGLEKLSNAVQGMGVSGYLLLSILIFLSAFPPMIGYGLYQTLSGFTFGFAHGFLISYLSALLGAVACFYVSRVWLQARIQRILQSYPNLEAVIHAVEKKEFRLFLLIRLSPYPFNLLNVVFAATNLSLATFASGTALSLFKIAFHIYIGANLTSFAKHILGEEEMTESDQRVATVRIIAAVVGSILAFGVMAYLYRVAKKAVAEANNEAAEGAESMAFLGEESQDNGSLEDWIEWHDVDDDDDNSTDLHTRENRLNDLEHGRA